MKCLGGPISVFFYDSINDYFDIIKSYIKAGLENNKFCLWIIPIEFETKKAFDLDDFIGIVDELLHTYKFKRYYVFKSSKKQVVLDKKKSNRITLEKSNEDINKIGTKYDFVL